MFYGSDEFNSAIENTHGNAPKTRLKFADDEILDLVSSIRYYGGSNDSDDVSIGTTTMARVEVSAYTDKLLTNREFLLEQGIELANGVVEYMPIGYFTIQKPSGDIDQVTFTAYDRMQKFEKPYSSSLDYPTTSALILNELCQICGIELATTLDNAIEVTENLKGYTCREVLGYIASMHGYFACIDRYGRLNLRWYSDTPIEKSLKKIWHFEKSQDNFEIAKVEIAKNSETNYVSGDGITTLHNSNPLATQEITDDVFAKLGGFSYSVGEIEMLDDARLDPWDMVSVEYYDGKTYTIPCMALEHDFKAYSTTVKSVGKSESENEYRFTGPTIQYLNRMAADLLVANRVIATKVDAEYVNSVAITTENFDAKVAEIKELIVEEIDGKYANIDLANIDIANINVGKIGELFAKVGLIDRATIVEGHITGFLDAVEVNANKITAGTLIADRILLSGGDKGVLYALNNLGELTSTNVDTLDGYVLTDRTINADKLIANSITANELDVNQIFGNEAVLNKLVSQEIFTDAIETNRIIVGASENASKALQEVNKTVKSIAMHYLATTLASGVTISTSGWTTTVQQIDATKKYLWTYQTITYVDNTTTDTSPVISGVYGNEGKDGKDGADGKDGIDGTNGTNGTNGVGVTSVIPLYYLKSNTTAPSAPTSAVTSTAVSSGVWTKSVPTYVNGYTYFTCTQTLYTNGTYSWSTVVIDNALTNANSTAYTANTTANGIKNNIYKSGTTLIDGAKIYTGSITADKIDVDDLFAQEITATGSISGATLISQADSKKVVVENGQISFYTEDTRGEGGFIETGNIRPASMGDTEAMGNWIFDGVQTANGADLDTVASQINKRSFILIGDSFGGGVINATTNGNGWINHFKEYTRNKYTVYNNQTPLGGVYGFASSRPFLDVLQDCETQIQDKSTITDIVVLGGTNDLGVSRTLIEPAIRAFAEYCHANFPNALVKIGLVGTAISSLYELVPYYRSCNKYGCVFVQDTLCLMNDTSLISDGTHLTQAGYDLYDPYICNAVLSGHCHYKFSGEIVVASSLIQDGPTIAFDITEKGFDIQFSSSTNDTLQGCYFSTTPTTTGAYTITIGTVNLPRLPFYYVRLQNGLTQEVVSINDRYVTSNARRFSVWLEPNGAIKARLGTPFYNDVNKSQLVVLSTETYTHLI